MRSKVRGFYGSKRPQQNHATKYYNNIISFERKITYEVGSLLLKWCVETIRNKAWFLIRARKNLKANLHEYDIKRASEYPRVVTLDAASVVVHPGWNSRNYANDLAVVVLARDFVPDNYSQIICLPRLTAAAGGSNGEPEEDMTAGRKLIVAGWGATKER